MSDGSTAASLVRVSYPDGLSAWGRETIEGRPFRAYLKRAHESAEPGDVWAEFVGVGCCGDTLDVDLRVEAVEGGSALGEETEFAFTAREDEDVDGNWRVQSAGGPRQ